MRNIHQRFSGDAKQEQEPFESQVGNVDVHAERGFLVVLVVALLSERQTYPAPNLAVDI